MTIFHLIGEGLGKNEGVRLLRGGGNAAMHTLNLSGEGRREKNVKEKVLTIIIEYNV